MKDQCVCLFIYLFISHVISPTYGGAAIAVTTACVRARLSVFICVSDGTYPSGGGVDDVEQGSASPD